MIIQNLSGSTVPAQASSDGPILPSATGGQQGQPAPSALPDPQAQAQMAAKVKAAVNNINQSMQFMNRGVTFAIDPSTKETLVKVVESGTGTVIKQIPSEQVLAIAQAIDAMQQGMLLQHKV
ncbi:MAG: flagellar protein FlaG [Betaproteobacteria bacterium]|nr:flagellar protein FlaG [Betaproteobacteria bacterium]MDE2211876.1 flagellar protein FlaG [Betaproteobacteria bacterium]